MDKILVTTSHKPDQESLEVARRAASIIGGSFVDRERLSLPGLRAKYDAQSILVISREQTSLYTMQGEYFFHPSMSVPRIKAIKHGKSDHMVEAMGLAKGDRVLDCTLGLGADAIVAAYAAGPTGRVLGLESVPVLAYVVKTGMQNYQTDSPTLADAISRIEVICADSRQYLAQQADNSFDIVYFDPMFRVPREKSSSMAPLRQVVNSEPIGADMIEDAVRVAKKRVVLKENCFSKEFARLGFTRVYGGKYSPIAFGVIDKQEAGR